MIIFVKGNNHSIDMTSNTTKQLSK
jgi:hypothetical protein